MIALRPWDRKNNFKLERPRHPKVRGLCRMCPPKSHTEQNNVLGWHERPRNHVRIYFVVVFEFAADLIHEDVQNGVYPDRPGPAQLTPHQRAQTDRLHPPTAPPFHPRMLQPRHPEMMDTPQLRGRHLSHHFMLSLIQWRATMLQDHLPNAGQIQTVFLEPKCANLGWPTRRHIEVFPNVVDDNFMGHRLPGQPIVHRIGLSPAIIEVGGHEWLCHHPNTSCDHGILSCIPFNQHKTSVNFQKNTTIIQQKSKPERSSLLFCFSEFLIFALLLRKASGQEY